MAPGPEGVSTRELIERLIEQASRLISVEIELLRSELEASAAKAPLGVRALVGGACLIFVGALALSAALCALLVRAGLPVDAACSIVGVVAGGVGWGFLRSGARALRPASLLPARSLAQISALLRRR